MVGHPAQLSSCPSFLTYVGLGLLPSFLLSLLFLPRSKARLGRAHQPAEESIDHLLMSALQGAPKNLFTDNILKFQLDHCKGVELVLQVRIMGYLGSLPHYSAPR